MLVTLELSALTGFSTTGELIDISVWSDSGFEPSSFEKTLEDDKVIFDYLVEAEGTLY